MTTVREVTFDLRRQHGLTTASGNPGSTELLMLAGLPDDFR
jgi:benzoylformate decarboxylase